MKKFSDAFVMSPDDITRALSRIEEKVKNTLNNIIGGKNMILKPPHFTGEIPQNIEMLSNSEIAMIMGENNAWVAYLRDQLSDIEIQISVCKEQESSVKSSLLRIMDKNLIASDARYVDVVENKLYFEALAKKVEIHLKRGDNNYKVLSRVITLRQNDEEKNRRHNSVQSGGKYAFRNS